MSIQQHLSLLGLRVEDRISGFQGTAGTISFMLNGSVQAIVTPLAKDNARVEGEWFDVKRLQGFSVPPVPMQTMDGMGVTTLAPGHTVPIEKAQRLFDAPVFSEERIGAALGSLGRRGTDKISGWSGVVTDVGFDLYGCIAVIVRRDRLNKDDNIDSGHWVDFNRLEVGKPVIDPPHLDVPRGREPGPAEKPARRETSVPR